MTDKLAAIILDALGPYSMRQIGLDYIQSLYNDPDYDSGLMATTGLAHTPISNSMIWGNYWNRDKIWVDFDTNHWTGGVDGFDPVDRVREDNARFYSRDDFDTNYIWDVLHYHGIESCALGIPISLPPYSFRADDDLEEAWFPHTEDLLERHVERKHKIILSHIDRGDQFICSSIKVPDQWLHGIGSGHVSDIFVREQSEVLDSNVEEMIDKLESNGYDWMIFGDHGAPVSGRVADFDEKNLLARHRKEALIVGTIDVPRYTNEVYGTILDYFGVKDVEYRGTRCSYPSLQEIMEGR